MNKFNKFAKELPEGHIKNLFRFFLYTLVKRFNFVMLSTKTHFKIMFFNGIILKFNENPVRDIGIPLKGYLKHYKIKEGDTIIDCGAYNGTFALYAAKLVGKSGKVIAFEPDDSNFEKLKKNIELNNIYNISLIKKGVWSKNTELIFRSEAGPGSSFITYEGDNIIKVLAVKLDDAIKELNIDKINFIKMDIEGAEIEAIRGAKKILESNNVNLAIASYHLINGEKTNIELEKILSKLNYKVNTSYPKHLTTYAHKRE